MNGKTFKIIGMVLSIAGGLLSIVTGFVEREAQHQEIVDIVKEELSQMRT